MSCPFAPLLSKNDLLYDMSYIGVSHPPPIQAANFRLWCRKKTRGQMTALKQFAKLETEGLWRAGPDAQRREVVVCFGEATLVLRDMADRPLTHWSLPAIARVNPGEMPAIFAPDEDASETLELSDDIMVEAIETVRRSVARRRPRPGRLRGWGLAVSVAIIGAGAGLWLPSALRDQTLSAASDATRASIGATLLGHVQRLTGTVCRNPRGIIALDRLKERALGSASHTQVLIVPDGVQTTLALPGGIILLNRALVEDYEDPAVPAGFLIAAEQARQEEDPLDKLLRAAGIRATFHLMTTGEIASDTLRNYAETIVGLPSPAVDTENLLSAFAQAQVTTRPFAYALDITGETTIGLIEADPVSAADVPLILGDGDWIALQGICD